MSSNEFEKVWRLLESLFPTASAKKKPVDKTVWKHALEPYSMQEITDRIMVYAKQNKFFPDLADITAKLVSVQFNAEAAIIGNARLFARIKGIEAPMFTSAEEAMTWFHGLEGSHERP